MVKSREAGKVLSFVVWLTGILVSLSVGFGMINGPLSLPKWLGGSVLALIVGWIVVITTIISAVIAIIDR
jgi:hypothetical protein